VRDANLRHLIKFACETEPKHTFLGFGQKSGSYSQPNFEDTSLKLGHPLIGIAAGPSLSFGSAGAGGLAPRLPAADGFRLFRTPFRRPC
jgi:hypothetical protein